MSWYKVGTVSVNQNSNAVIGTGTKFIANSRVGDAFRGPDGAWYEVTNIASDTAMAIFPPYQGGTVADGAYSLAPMQGYVKDSADQLRAIIGQMGGVEQSVDDAEVAASAALASQNAASTSANAAGDSQTAAAASAEAASLSETNTASSAAASESSAVAAANSAASIGEAETNAAASAEAAAESAAEAAQSAEGRAASGDNSDITSLSGLTTPLSVEQGGTGATTAALARAALQLGDAALADIVGLAADGAIIESGSNANGSWTKWADGTMICTRVRADIDIVMTARTENALAGYYNYYAWTYPQVFIVTPSVSHSWTGVVDSTGAASVFVVGGTNAIGISSVTLKKWSLTNSTTVSWEASMAVGKWKV